MQLLIIFFMKIIEKKMIFYSSMKFPLNQLRFLNSFNINNTWISNINLRYFLLIFQENYEQKNMFLNRCWKFMFYSSDCYKKMLKKCNSPGIFSVLVVFLGVFFRKFAKNRKKIPKCNSPRVTTVLILEVPTWNCLNNWIV